MTAGAPWSVKGIDPKAREVAKDLARRSGMTLGEWLNQMIDTVGGDDTQAGSAGAEVETSPLAAAELARVADALDKVSRRIEDAETRSTLAVSGIGQSVTGLLSRLDGAERNQNAIAARFEGGLEEVRTEQTRAAERLARVEEEVSAPRSLEAMRALESAVGKVASHAYDADQRARDGMGTLRGELDILNEKVERMGADPALADLLAQRIGERLDEAERRTSTAVRSLETAFADLDQRLRNTEQRNDVPEERLERLANELAKNFSEARAELAERLRDTAGGRLDTLERSLQEMSAHVGDAERRSAQAIEKMGHEVLRMADHLGHRMESVETRGAKAIEQVGGDVKRIADSVEARFRRADAIQAESLEKLGTEIAKITERLAERIGNAERRSAQAIDDVGEQVSRVTERMNQRTERASADLADRIRQSEERTARLLEEAREKIDQRLSDAQRRLDPPEPASSLRRPLAPPIDEDFYAEPDLPAGPFGRAEYAAPPAPDRESPFISTAAAHSFTDAAFEDEAFNAAFDDAPDAGTFGSPAPAVETESFGAFSDEPYATPAAAAFDTADAPFPQDNAAGSTRDLIDQARAAARAAQGEDGKTKGPMFGGFGLGKKKPKKPASSVKTALMMSATAAALGVSAFGLTLVNAQWVGDDKRAEGLPQAGPLDAADSVSVGASPMAAMAVGPSVALPPGIVEPASAPEMARGDQGAGLYASAVARIEAKDFSAVADLRRAANLGNAQAQFYLGKLHEAGDAGLKKDMVEARRWTERAAQNGERKAMHNLALYYFEGVGGPKNTTAAAQWFRRASDLGLADSQYNLARLYQEGLGVGQNPAEAYKWYVIAGRGGDGEAKLAAERLKSRLTPQALTTAQRAAMNFRPETPAAPAAPARMASAATTVTGDAGLVAAQRALSRLGYYQGPQDGQTSPALRMAIAAFQRDNNLAQTSVVDAQLAQRFASIAR